MTAQEIIPPGQAFREPPDLPAVSHNTAASMSREMAQVQAEFRMAQVFPRDEAQAEFAIVAACRRPSFAPDVEYVFPRGDSKVRGPSVYYAREAARIWGRIRTGYRVLERTEDEILIEGCAMDLQSLRIETAQQRSKIKIQRKQEGGKTKWVEPDERDIGELIGRIAAKLIRNCILNLIPPYITEEACKAARETNDAAAAGDLDKDRPTMLRSLLAAFAPYGVMKAHIEARLGHPLEAVTPQELAELRASFKSIKDGQAGAADLFDLSPPATKQDAATATALDAARARMDALKKQPEHRPTEGASPDEPQTSQPPATEGAPQ